MAHAKAYRRFCIGLELDLGTLPLRNVRIDRCFDQRLDRAYSFNRISSALNRTYPDCTSFAPATPSYAIEIHR